MPPYLKEALSKAFSYLFIVFWVFQFLCVKRFAKYVSVVVIVLLVIEVAGSMSHFGTFTDALSPPVHLSFALLLFSTALFLALHHHKLSERLLRQQGIVVALRALFRMTLTHTDDRQTDERRISALRDFFHVALLSMVTALEGEGRLGSMHAGLLVREPTEEHFHLISQYPAGTFPSEIRLDGKTSAAGACATGKTNEIIYVPWTSCRHGVQLVIETELSPETDLNIIENAYENVSDKYQANIVLKSLACVRVPNETAAFSRINEHLGIRPASCVILCLGSTRVDAVGPLEFNVLQLVAAVYAMALKGRA